MRTKSAIIRSVFDAMWLCFCLLIAGGWSHFSGEDPLACAATFGLGYLLTASVTAVFDWQRAVD